MNDVFYCITHLTKPINYDLFYLFIFSIRPELVEWYELNTIMH